MNITQSTDSSADSSTDILDDSDLMSDLSGEAELQLNISQPPDSSDDSSTDIHDDSDLMSYLSGEAELPLNITQSTDSSDDSSTDILDDSDLMSYLSGEAELQEKIENSISQLTQDLSDQYSSDEPGIPSSLEPAEKRLKVMADIEALFLKLMRDTVEENPLKLLLRNTRSWENCVFDTKLRLKSRNDSVVTEVKFSERRSRMKFSLIYFVLAEIYKLLATQETCTKRELYYHHVDRFRSQSVLDGVLNDVSCFLEVPLYELNVFATSKGLVYGPLKLVIGNDEVDCGNAKGVLIPDNVCNTCEVQSDAKFILVLEKDAIFEKLLDNGASKILSSCIFMTGKGCPDINTRLLLRILWDNLRIPIFALVDPDPWGIEIMCIYRFGSLSKSHQADQLAVPSIRWLGVHPTEVEKLYDKRLPLLQQDKAKLKDLLRRPYIKANESIKKEIQFMMDNSFKAEIEGVEITLGYLTNVYLPQKIICADFK